MAPATANPTTKTSNKTGKKRASTVIKDNNITLDRLRVILDDGSIGLTTLISPREQAIVADAATKPAAAPAAPVASAATPAAPSSNGTASQQVVRSRSRKSKGMFEPIKLLRPKKLRLTPADRMTLNQLQLVLNRIGRLKEQPREPRRLGSDVAIQDVLFPERWIRMPLPVFQQRVSDGTLPPLHVDTKKQLAEPLSRLSLVNRTCRICNEALERPPYLGMLDGLLSGKCILPFDPNHRDAMKFTDRHKGCSVILNMMTDVEIRLMSIPEGDTKEAERLRQYRLELAADDGKKLVEWKESEHKPLTKDKTKARLSAIQDNVRQQREALS